MGCVSSKNLDDNVSRGFDVKGFSSNGNHIDRTSEKGSKKSVVEEDISKYPMPLKDYDGDRFSLQHYLFRYIWQSNFSSPIEEKLSKAGAKVLDIGWVYALSRYIVYL